MSLELIRQADLVVSPWRNGAGRKADIASDAGWLVGFAWLDADAPFSDYAGHDRTITLLEGRGFTLDFEGRPSLAVSAPYAPARFDGGWPTQCRISDGPCMVLNAMTARASHKNVVRMRDKWSTPMLDSASVAAFFVVVLTGSATIATMTGKTQIMARDAARITGPATIREDDGARVCTIAIEKV